MNYSIPCALQDVLKDRFIPLELPLQSLNQPLQAILDGHALPCAKLDPCTTSFFLHIGCNLEDMCLKVLTIFGCIPKPFQILHCHKSTKKDELYNILASSAKFSFMVVIVEVNKLSHQMQEVHKVQNFLYIEMVA